MTISDTNRGVLPHDGQMPEVIEHKGLGEESLAYVIPRMTRSFEAAERFVAAVDRLALERQSRPTRNLCRDALESIDGPAQARLI